MHVGAYAPQATTIDMVVNKAWVDDLDQMVFGNGLLISTDDVGAVGHPQADPEDRRRPGLGPGPRHRLAAGPRPQRRADGVPHRWLDRERRSARSTTPCSAGAGSRPDPAWVARSIAHRAGADPGQRHLPRRDLPAAAGRARGGRQPRPGRRDPPRRVRRLLLPALHRRVDHAVQPLLRARPRHERPRQPARHGRRDGPRGRGDLQEVGLRLGRRLGLHRPDALRARRRSSTPASESATGRMGSVPRMRAAQVVTPTGPVRRRDPRGRRADARTRRRPGGGAPRRHLLPGPAAEQGRVPAQARAAVHPRRRLRRDGRSAVRTGSRPATGWPACCPTAVPRSWWPSPRCSRSGCPTPCRSTRARRSR